MAVSKKNVSDCPINAALSVIDGRWKGTILWRLCDRPMGTSELKRSIPGIAERMLIRHLHEPVDDGIIVRHDARVVPPCVHYSISEYGATMTPVSANLCGWERSHMRRTARSAAGIARRP
ncbi:winged helix-turn-helix transcriptional regulator [Mycobacterium decipiens]|uniref:Transcriptional regulator n=1 Tax=Mycobacterium decipiens TaxID=1430326 RepID=A0A1X2LYW5_9MYCO|nr:helix-turn-helix domain-containing protein [Mycobacterium decipiens]OSC42477.1 transcriptional regulator [Mycobacterium decipiens]